MIHQARVRGNEVVGATDIVYQLATAIKEWLEIGICRSNLCWIGHVAFPSELQESGEVQGLAIDNHWRGTDWVNDLCDVKDLILQEWPLQSAHITGPFVCPRLALATYKEV